MIILFGIQENGIRRYSRLSILHHAWGFNVTPRAKHAILRLRAGANRVSLVYGIVNSPRFRNTMSADRGYAMWWFEFVEESDEWQLLHY